MRQRTSVTMIAIWFGYSGLFPALADEIVDLSKHTPLEISLDKVGPTATGTPAAVRFDISTGVTTRVKLRQADDKLPYSPPDFSDNPSNEPQFVGPLTPPDPRLVKISFDLNGLHVCSGAVVGRRLILTAGHCVHAGGGGPFARSVKVYPGYENSRAPFGGFDAASLVAFAGWTDEGDFAHDIALIALRSDLPPAVGSFGVRALTAPCDVANDFRWPEAFERRHYNGRFENLEKQMSLAWGGGGNCARGMFLTRQRTYPGSSGSPNLATDGGFIFTVHSAEGQFVSVDAVVTKAKACVISNGGNIQSCSVP